MDLPEGVSGKKKAETLSRQERDQLRCRACGNWLRPHVLWFDESYNEHYYHFNSALETALRTHLLITVGTTGTTTLPNHVVERVLRSGGLMIDINVADNPFADMAMRSGRGICVRGPSSLALAELASTIESIHTNL